MMSEASDTLEPRDHFASDLLLDVKSYEAQCSDLHA